MITIKPNSHCLQSRALAARVITELGLEANKTFTHANIVTPNPVHRVMSWMFGPLRLFSSYVAPLFKSEPKTKESDTNPAGRTVGQARA